MQVNAIIIGVSQDTWFRGSRDERQVTVLVCAEKDKVMGRKLRTTFEYTLGKDEVELANWSSMEFHPITLVVDTVKVGTGGQIRFGGIIDQSTLPKREVGKK